MKTINQSSATLTVEVPQDPTNPINNQLLINCDSSANAIAITLPAISTFGNSPNYQILINDSGGVAATNNITITCNAADKINNAASIVLANNGGSITLQISGTTDWQAIAPINGLPAVAITANADGLTTAIIPNGNCYVTVTSGNSAHLVTLPAPIPGTTVWLTVGANGYKLRSSAPATIGINGGTGASASSTVATTITLRLFCVSATAWISTSFTTAGVVAAGAVAS